MNKIDELRLIAQCALADNRRAFGQLVEAYQPKLRRFLMNLTNGDAMLTDDLAQETFIKAYVSVRKFKGLSSFGTWIYRIAYNEFYSHTRKQHITQGVDQDIPDHIEAQAIDEQIEAEMTVKQAMKLLSDTERAITTLFYIDDMAIKDIAKIMEMPDSTVKSHLRRSIYRNVRRR